MTDRSDEGLARDLSRQLTILEKLLARCGERGWADAMIRCRQKVESSSEGHLSDAGRLILTMFGGMGSLNDVVLHRDGRALKAENDRLGRQKEWLWQLAKAAIVGSAP